MEDPTIQNFLRTFFDSFQVVRLVGDGSTRKIFRILAAKKSFILVASANQKENKRFIDLSLTLRDSRINVPKIYHTNEQNTLYLLEDLGKKNFAEDLLAKKFTPQAIIDSYLMIIGELEKLHSQTHILKTCRIFGKLSNSFQNHISYFQKYFLNYFDKTQKYTNFLQTEQDLLVKTLKDYCQRKKKGIVTKDFQARNILFLRQKPYFIDYQDICEGHIFYDLASLLFASSCGLNAALREKLFAKLSQDYFLNEEDFFVFFCFVLLRRLRSLGTYTKLGVIKGKKNFQNHFQNTLQELILIQKSYNVYKKFPKTMQMISDFSQSELLKFS